MYNIPELNAEKVRKGKSPGLTCIKYVLAVIYFFHRREGGGASSFDDLF